MAKIHRLLQRFHPLMDVRIGGINIPVGDALHPKRLGGRADDRNMLFPI